MKVDKNENLIRIFTCALNQETIGKSFDETSSKRMEINVARKAPQ